MPWRIGLCELISTEQNMSLLYSVILVLPLVSLAVLFFRTGDHNSAHFCAFPCTALLLLPAANFMIDHLYTRACLYLTT